MLKTMRLIQFYRNEIPTDDGDFIEDILNWNHTKLEGCHSYVQWLFPTKEESVFHPEVPTLTDEEIAIFRKDPFLQITICKAFNKMLGFYGLFDLWLCQVQGSVFKTPEEAPLWLREFNHNFLRITRILKSLRYLGFEKESKELFAVLSGLKNFCNISDNSFQYWKEAANGNL